MPSTAQLAADAVRRFGDWVAERDRAGNWNEYVRGGKLNRSELAKECEFSRSAFQQNPGLMEALTELEKRLTAQGLLAGTPVSTQELPDEVRAELGMADERTRRALAARATLERRVKTLEEQNASLRAENNVLRERLRRSALAEEHLSQTGRMLPP